VDTHLPMPSLSPGVTALFALRETALSTNALRAASGMQVTNSIGLPLEGNVD